MPTARLTCVTPEAAKDVLAEWRLWGGPNNIVRYDEETPDVVIIDYVDKRYPLDVADWAFENGHAHDDDAARVIAGL